MSKPKLTPKQALFVKEYLVDLSALNAAVRAGYSKKTAKQIGAKNLTKPEIASAIQKEMNKRFKRIEITADKVLQEIAKLAFANMADYVDWSNGAIAIKASEGLTIEQMAAVSEISENVSEKSSNIKIKLHDKKSALELLGKHLKMFTDKVEHSGDPDNPIENNWKVEFVNASTESKQ